MEYFAEIMPGDEYLKDPGTIRKGNNSDYYRRKKIGYAKKPGKQPLSGHFPKNAKTRM